MKSHPLYGGIFETFVVSELMKRTNHKGNEYGFSENTTVVDGTAGEHEYKRTNYLRR